MKMVGVVERDLHIACPGPCTSKRMTSGCKRILNHMANNEEGRSYTFLGLRTSLVPFGILTSYNIITVKIRIPCLL